MPKVAIALADFVMLALSNDIGVRAAGERRARGFGGAGSLARYWPVCTEMEVLEIGVPVLLTVVGVVP